MDLQNGRWKKVRPNYLFPVRAMMRVFRAIFLRRLEELEGNRDVVWPEEAGSVEERRGWRQVLARKSWNIYSKATLGNTRAVVRYLARYTSRIAMSNQRILEVDPVERTVRFSWKDYKDGGRRKDKTLPGNIFIRRFLRHLVPEGLRRIRCYGWLAGRKGRLDEVPGAQREHVAERASEPNRPACPRCQGAEWLYGGFYQANQDARHCVSMLQRFSLYGASGVP